MLLHFQRRLPQLKLPKVVNLDIGCGSKKEVGFIGIDIRDCEQEIVWDVRDGIPFPDNSVDEVWSSHTIEHFDNGEAEEFLIEVYRILKSGGKLVVAVPHQTDPTAYYFDHKTFWNEERIDTLPGVPGLEGFKIIKNQMRIDEHTKSNRRELVFILQKV